MKILIVDDHTLFREGLCHVLTELEEHVCILEAADHDSAIQHVSTTPDLDLVLLDLNMPGKNGFIVLETITKHFPALPVVIISASNERDYIQRTLDTGAVGYIPKETTGAVMLHALRMVLSGGIYVPPNMAKNEAVNLQPHDNHTKGLTPRQLEVLSLLTQGHSNKVIASQMNLAEATIKMHVTSILKNLGVNNRTQAILAAEKQGLFQHGNKD